MATGSARICGGSVHLLAGEAFRRGCVGGADGRDRVPDGRLLRITGAAPGGGERGRVAAAHMAGGDGTAGAFLLAVDGGAGCGPGDVRAGGFPRRDGSGGEFGGPVGAAIGRSPIGRQRVVRRMLGRFAGGGAIAAFVGASQRKRREVPRGVDEDGRRVALAVARFTGRAQSLRHFRPQDLQGAMGAHLSLCVLRYRRAGAGGGGAHAGSPARDPGGRAHHAGVRPLDAGGFHACGTRILPGDAHGNPERAACGIRHGGVLPRHGGSGGVRFSVFPEAILGGVRGHAAGRPGSDRNRQRPSDERRLGAG